MELRRYNRFNPKRQISAPGTHFRPDLDGLADAVSCSGNPEHKKSSGDFDLSPPARARAGKTLCADAGIFLRKDARKLLREGLKRGSVSETFVDGWPKRIWAIADGGAVLEAQRDGSCSHHGYPLSPGDPFHDVVIKFWKSER